MQPHSRAVVAPSDIYAVIGRRRDVRCEFAGGGADPDVLRRILEAAHAAPSVGLTQPWDFVLIDDDAVRSRFADHVGTERERFMASLAEREAATFSRIKIEGVRESSMSIVVTYDPSRGAPAVLGRFSIADAGLYSTCLAIENLWLAATAEGWGVGWVSFFREEFVSELLGLPAGIRPVAWLCVGAVSHLQDIPDLERAGWRSRRPLSAALHRNHWGSSA